MKVNFKQFKPVKYGDRPIYPQIVDNYENELKQEFDKMLVKMGKDIGNKLNSMVK